MLINSQLTLKAPLTFLSKAENNLLKHLKKPPAKFETNYSEFINHIRNAEHRPVGSKFRIGNHNLKIETGRFTIPKTPEDLRICDHCNLNSVEHEMHMFFHCDL